MLGAAGHPRRPRVPDQPDDEERNVKKSFGVAIFVSALIAAGAVAAQGVLVDDADADKVIASTSRQAAIS